MTGVKPSSKGVKQPHLKMPLTTEPKETGESPSTPDVSRFDRMPNCSVPRCSVSIAVPTYQRGDVLLRTLGMLFGQHPLPAEILVVDQTEEPASDVATQLTLWDRQGCIRWIRLPEPSITRAMNVALSTAKAPVVLFLDDDIIPAPNLIGTHAECLAQDEQIWAVAGQVLQPGEQPRDATVHCARSGLRAFLDFPFYSTKSVDIANVMAGNLAVRRDKAILVGGFDENFKGVAYRFETEFARRLIRHGGRILFEPAASIRHLHSKEGGTRAHGNHLESPSPAHGVGEYYFALRSGVTWETLTYMLRRPIREIVTRFHLRHPWYIPGKLLGEARAFCWACRLAMQGPSLMSPLRRPGSTRETRGE